MSAQEFLVFVCLCNALTDWDICRAAETCQRVADVYRCCGCAPECGKCVPYVRDMLRTRGHEDAGLGETVVSCEVAAS
jgi:bacterioferritin-associated ferredoxin